MSIYRNRLNFYRGTTIFLAFVLVVAVGVLLYRNSQYVTADTNYRKAKTDATAITVERDALKRDNTRLRGKVKEGMSILDSASKQLDQCAELAEAYGG